MYRINRCLSGVLLLMLLSVPQLGCQRYGEVTPRAYEISTSLYSICNRKDDARIAAVETVIDDSHTNAEITPDEKEWLMAIVEKAEADDWTAAMQDARTMMMEQVDD